MDGGLRALSGIGGHSAIHVSYLRGWFSPRSVRGIRVMAGTHSHNDLHGWQTPCILWDWLPFRRTCVSSAWMVFSTQCRRHTQLEFDCPLESFARYLLRCAVTNESVPKGAYVLAATCLSGQLQILLGSYLQQGMHNDISATLAAIGLGCSPRWHSHPSSTQRHTQLAR